MPEQIFVEGFRERTAHLRSLGFGVRNRRLYDRDGLLISGPRCNLAVERLGIEADHFLFVRDPKHDAYLLPHPPEVILEPHHREHMQQWSAMEPVLREFAIEHTLSIVAGGPHGYERIVRTTAHTLYLYAYSVPTGSSPSSWNVSQIFGRSLNRYEQGRGVQPSRLPGGLNLVDETQDVVIAQLYGGSLFVLFNLPHRGVAADELLRELLDRLLTHQPPVLASPDPSAVAELRRQEARRGYEGLCKQRLEAAEIRVAKTIETARAERTKFLAVLTEQTRTIEQALVQQRQLALQRELGQDRWTEEFDRLIVHPAVADVAFSGGGLVVTTYRLVTEPLLDGKRRVLGRYRITIPAAPSAGSSTGGIRVENLSQQIEFVHHPHDRGSGALCLGNLQDDILGALSRFEYSVVLTFLVAFLKEVNLADHIGQRGYRWPIAVAPEVIAEVKALPLRRLGQKALLAAARRLELRVEDCQSKQRLFEAIAARLALED